MFSKFIWSVTCFVVVRNLIVVSSLIIDSHSLVPECILCSSTAHAKMTLMSIFWDFSNYSKHFRNAQMFEKPRGCFKSSYRSPTHILSVHVLHKMAALLSGCPQLWWDQPGNTWDTKLAVLLCSSSLIFISKVKVVCKTKNHTQKDYKFQQSWKVIFLIPEFLSITNANSSALDISNLHIVIDNGLSFEESFSDWLCISSGKPLLLYPLKQFLVKFCNSIFSGIISVLILRVSLV